MMVGLLHSWRNGHAKLDAYLDDYAALANSLVSLYEANFKERWIDDAVQLMDIVLDKFADPAGGGFFYTAIDHEQLIARNKELTDSSTPERQFAGGQCTVAAWSAAWPRRLSGCGRSKYSRPGCRLCSERRWPRGRCCSRSICTWARHTSWCSLATGKQPRTIGSLGNSESLSATLSHRLSLPNHGDRPATHAASTNFSPANHPDGQPILYVCQNFACQAPAIGLDAIAKKLDAPGVSIKLRPGAHEQYVLVRAAGQT